MAKSRSNACSACHKRKIKCDVTTQRPCTNCRLFGTVCQLHLDERRKRKTRDSGNASNVNPTTYERVKNVLSDGGLFGMDYLKDLIRRQDDLKNVSYYSHTRNFSEHLMYFPSSSHYQIYADSPSEVRSYVDTQLHMKRMTAFQLPDVDATVWEILKLEGALLLPKRSICKEMIDIFFEHNLWFFPFIKKAEVLQQFEDSKCSILLLQCIIRCAIVSTNDPRFLDDNHSTHLATNILTKRIKSLLNYNFEMDPLTRIQAVLLLTKSESLSTGELGVEESVFWGASLINQFGFHRGNLEKDPFLARDKKLCYWYWFLVSNAYLNGNVFELDSDIEMLSLEDFPEEIPYEEKFVFIKMVELSGILKNIKKLNYCAKNEYTIDSIENLLNFTNIIDKWKSTLPPFFRECLESDRVMGENSSPLFIYVQLLYCKVVLYLHKKSWLYGTFLEEQYNISIPICCKTIRLILDIGDTIIANEYLSSRLHDIFNRIMMETLQLIHYKYYNDPDSHSKETCIALATRMKIYFEHTQNHWMTSNVSAVISMNNFPMNTPKDESSSSTISPLHSHDHFDFSFQN